MKRSSHNVSTRFTKSQAFVGHIVGQTSAANAREPNTCQSLRKALEALTAAHIGRRISDGESLYGIVRATAETASILFRWRYRFNGKLKDFTCGTWPSSSLATIRKNRDDAERLGKESKDPVEEIRARKLKRQAEQAEAIAREQAPISAAEALRSRLTVKQLFERWENWNYPRARTKAQRCAGVSKKMSSRDRRRCRRGCSPHDSREHSR